MRWRLILEEFGPKLTYIKGEQNIVADTLSRMDLTEEDFSADAFAGDFPEDFPTNFPLTYNELQQRQEQDDEVQRLYNKYDTYTKTEYKYSDKTYELIVKDNKIVVPKALQMRATDWYHRQLMHAGETRTEITIAQHYAWIGIRKAVQKVCKACAVCRQHKKRKTAHGLVPAKKTPEVIPWHTLCVDLTGPYKFGDIKKNSEGEVIEDNLVHLHCLTMIDPATGWFEITDIPTKRADYVVNYLEWSWLSRCPSATSVANSLPRSMTISVGQGHLDNHDHSR